MMARPRASREPPVSRSVQYDDWPSVVDGSGFQASAARLCQRVAVDLSSRQSIRLDLGRNHTAQLIPSSAASAIKAAWLASSSTSNVDAEPLSASAS